MTIAEARTAVYQAFQTDWDAADAIATYEGEAFKPPEPPDEPWIRISMQFAAANQRTIGPVGLRRMRRAGTIFVQIFVPRDAGMTLADELSDLVKEIVEGETIGEVHCYASTPRVVGTDEAWLQVNVSTPFDVDDVR